VKVSFQVDLLLLSSSRIYSLFSYFFYFSEPGNHANGGFLVSSECERDKWWKAVSEVFLKERECFLCV